MTKRIFKTVLILSVLILSPSIFALSYRVLEPGLEYANFTPDGNPEVKLHFLKVDLKKFKVKVIDARDLKAKSMTVKSMAEQTQAVAVINANFFDENDFPLGLVLIEGKIKNPPKKISWWAALLLKGDEAQILKVQESAAVQEFDNAIQAGPRLVIAGKVPKLKEEISPKSAVGVDAGGKLVLIVSEGNVEINQLAKILAAPEKKGGVGLIHALNLDGGSSTQFFAKVGDFDIYIPGLSKVPVALGVFRKPVSDSKRMAVPLQ